ncbi:ROK family protein [Pseudogemmobacter sp. W21_MBD1_M6]|uniref:ROK family protein n=1 Tax=Pseudogemmobacter sp. W21_MBD1_M6 TaxID=3240271 RepID=UPI003F95596F
MADPGESDAGKGCGPLITTSSDAQRPIRQQIFEHVRAAGLIPRVDVARDLRVSAGTVTTLTSSLIDAGLLEEVAGQPRDGDAGRGRPPVALGVRGAAHYVLGAKLSDHSHTAVILDFAGNRVADASFPHRLGPVSLGDILDDTERLIAAVLGKAGLALSDLSAVGLGVPGFVESASGRVLWSPVFLERDVALRDEAAKRLGLPVYIDNDANLVTLAELWFGGGRHLSDFAVVTIEHGIGMGLVLNHRLFRGGQGLGTELGHIKVQMDGALCRCGQRGCLEAYVSDYALVREASTALNWTSGEGQSAQVMLESLFDHAKAGNQAARSIFHRAGRYLAVGLANIINLFDPNLIILSGERMRFDYLYAEEVLEEMNRMTLNIDRPRPRIEINAWGDLVWAQGAAALALSELTDSVLGAGAATEGAVK